MMVNGDDVLRLTPVGLYSHVRWIQFERDGMKPLGGPDQLSYLYKKRPASVNISRIIPYQDWMNGTTLMIERTDYGCCNKPLGKDDVDLARWSETIYYPVLKYIRPIAATDKTRVIEGEAFIDFPVDQTIIYPEYRNNTVELDSIIRTIDYVRTDPDATIDTVWLKGFASPESPYKHNTDLAKGRTAALKKYIQNLYHFDGVEIITDYEPEDWAGLRKRVVASNLAHRDEIIELIDSTMDPDVKEARIKKLYPEEYKFMLQNFYPPLRHTNYKVSYTVRSFSDPEEILRVMHTRPGNLDLDEFYIAAASLDPGSPEYNEVFETAVLMHPQDPTANLNAANAAITRGDYDAARRYLGRAGNTAEADYARSVLEVLTGNYTEAKSYLQNALDAGLNVDPDELQTLIEVIETNNTNK